MPHTLTLIESGLKKCWHGGTVQRKWLCYPDSHGSERLKVLKKF